MGFDTTSIEEIRMLTLEGSSERTDPDVVAAWLATIYAEE